MGGVSISHFSTRIKLSTKRLFSILSKKLMYFVIPCSNGFSTEKQ